MLLIFICAEGHEDSRAYEARTGRRWFRPSELAGEWEPARAKAGYHHESRVDVLVLAAMAGLYQVADLQAIHVIDADLGYGESHQHEPL